MSIEVIQENDTPIQENSTEDYLRRINHKLFDIRKTLKVRALIEMRRAANEGLLTPEEVTDLQTFLGLRLVQGEGLEQAIFEEGHLDGWLEVFDK